MSAGDGLSRAKMLEILGGLAPLEYAESWDNVGLLVDPPGAADRPVRRVVLTIDLTEGVMAEAFEDGPPDLIVAYHPPIFGGLKRLSSRNPLSRSLMRCVASGCSVWSPHTALDAVPGGVNDWLAEGLGPASEVRAITPLAQRRPEHEELPTGAGRVVTLATPTGLDVLVDQLKGWLGLERVRVARAPRHEEEPVHRVAVCPGAGGGLFGGMKPGEVDLLVTGEMRHHDVLARVAQGGSVVLTDHTNTERGFLPRWAKGISQACAQAGGDVRVEVAQADRDPLEVV